MNLRKKEEKEKLPKELTGMVNLSLKCLGDVIAEEEGRDFYDLIEDIRTTTKTMRGKDSLLEMKQLYSKISKNNEACIEKIAKAFSVKMELINICENSYRTWRLESELHSARRSETHAFKTTFVLTAHPTEARSPQFLILTKKIQEEVLNFLKEKRVEFYLERLTHLLNLLWKAPLSRQTKPEVSDEAQYIVDLVLHQKSFSALLEHYSSTNPVQIRTWVGGDKDGHPGVDEKVSRKTLEISRLKILDFCQNLLGEIFEDIQLQESARIKKAKTQSLIKEIISLKKLFEKCEKISNQDGRNIEELKKKTSRVIKLYCSCLSTHSSAVKKLSNVFKLFPALVIPVEMREDAKLVDDVVQGKSKNAAIVRMLKFFKNISKGSRIEYYTRGLILSMVNDQKDWINGVKMVESVFGKAVLPVIPLFEKKKSIEQSDKILNRFLSEASQYKNVKKYWGAKVEIMLGYSDSAKEIGVLASRHFIAQSVTKLEDEFKKWEGVMPIYFHGSGGSVARGGGSIEEQSSWWPKSALSNYKVTLQGEMIQRSFSSEAILKSNLLKIIKIQGSAKVKKRRPTATFKKFCDSVEREYRKESSAKLFLDEVLKATPYPFLAELKIGSRPSARKAVKSVQDLRAIPWVLCWTQTRTLFPTWWGVGTAWKELSRREKEEVKSYIRSDALTMSFVKQLGFTLKKIELSVWALYLKELMPERQGAKEVYLQFQEEYNSCVQFVRAISGQKSLLWFKPWLEQSITLRAPSIHPLNVVQVIALKNKNINLLRKSVTGISSGMLTTG